MKMPTPNRQNFVIRKTRTEFKANVKLTDPDTIKQCIRLADTNLDTVLVQAEHLTNLMKDPSYQVDIQLTTVGNPNQEEINFAFTMKRDI